MFIFSNVFVSSKVAFIFSAAIFAFFADAVIVVIEGKFAFAVLL